MFDSKSTKLVFVSTDSIGCRQKVSHVVKLVKADLIRAQNTLQKLFAPRQSAENFVARKRNVKKEANGNVGKATTNELRKKHQLIVVNPNSVILCWSKKKFTTKKIIKVNNFNLINLNFKQKI